jgi:hypothetical protein
MSDAFWIALVSGVPGIIAAMTSAYVAMKQAQLAKQVEVVHVATNSMHDAMLKVTGEAEKAKGKLEGAAEERSRNQTDL